MKYIYLMIQIALLSINSFSQVNSWQWAHSAGGSVNDESLSTATDAEGNVFICGKFNSSSITIGSTTLTNSNNTGTNSDIFLAKYNSSGLLLWAKGAGGTMEDVANSVATDASGNVFICGHFESSSIVFGTTTLTNIGTGHDLFLAKYDASGNVLWAKSAGSQGYEHANSVSTDASGNVVIAGYFSSASFSIGNYTLNNAGNFDVFVAKYDALGNPLWAKYANGLYLDQANAVTTDVNDNIYITGYYGSNSLVFETSTISHTGNNSQYNIFTAKYNSEGTLQWVKQAGSYPNNVSYAIATDFFGNVYVSGYYESSAFTFGPSTLTNVNSGYSDILILKYDSLGNEIVAIGIGDSGNEAAQSINVDASGNIYLAGWYQLGNLIIGSDTLVSAGGLDGFVTKINATGTPLWSTSVGYSYNDQFYGSAIDELGNIYLTGYFQSSQLFLDPFLLSNSATGGVSSDIFLGKITNTPLDVSQINNRISEFVIYPNPFSNHTTISFEEVQNNTTIKITDLLGQEIKTINFRGKQLLIDRTEMKAGIYLVQTTDEKKNIAARKIIVQ